MADIAELLKVMQEQMQLQREQMRQQEERHKQQEERHKQQEVSNEERHKQQLALMQQQMEDTRKAGGTMVPQHQTPPFPAFDSTAELWKDYLLRFETFVNANSVPDDKKALVFLTNQTSGTYKLITNYALQQDVPTTANAMKFSDITGFMSSHYDPTQFTVRERYKFWSTIKRKPGETPTELAARVRQMATTCDFPAIKNPLDEAMRTCFICAINNEAILKSVFREKEEKLTFAKAVEIATEVEEAAKTAKAQVYSKPDEVQMIHTKKPQRNNHHHHHQKSPPPPTKPSPSTTARCYRCGKNGHAMKDCRLSNAVCNFCGKKGHIEAACITKQRSSKVNLITTSTINSLTDEVKEPSPSVAVTINNRKFPFLVDTGASCNLLSSSTWKKIGTPTLQKDETRPLISASNDVIPTSGSVDLDVTVTTEDGDANSQILPFTVTDQLDILGTNAINSLQLTIRNNPVKVHVDNIRTIRSHQHLQESCLQICKEFPDLWKPERCVSCAEHQNKPPKPANHPWMMPEKPWSRIHVDHAINFMGNNWLIVTDAYSKYPCIHQTSSTSTQATTTLLEEDFAHFGYPHTIVSDNATTFSSAEFQLWCHHRGIKHLTGAPYHPATNGAAERMVQSFKQSLKKSKLPPRPALQEFLMQYRRTPLNTGLSPSQLLNGRQLRTKIDALLPSPAHIAQEHQAREATKSQQKEQTAVQHVRTAYDVGAPCYALYCGPHQTSTPRWVPATITRVHGTRTFTVKVHPRGPLWKRHLEQLQPRYGVAEDTDPGVVTSEQSTSADSVPEQPKAETLSPPAEVKTSDQTVPEYGRHNPRRSSRQRKPRQLYDAQ